MTKAAFIKSNVLVTLATGRTLDKQNDALSYVTKNTSNT
jgi:hypothetical protein